MLPPGTAFVPIGPEAVTQQMPCLADQAQALTSDALDGRDGVDASDVDIEVPVAPPRRRSPQPRGHR